MSSGSQPRRLDLIHSSRFTHKRTFSLPLSVKASASRSVVKPSKSVNVQPIYEDQEYDLTESAEEESTTMSRRVAVTMPAPLAPPQQGMPYHHPGRMSYIQQEVVPPQYDASQLATELGHVKHLHAQDRHYFQNEIGHLRRLLAASDRALHESQEAHKNQTVQLERIVRRRDVITEERDALKTIREGLDNELMEKKEELRGLVKILANIDKELEGTGDDGRPARWSIAPSTTSLNSSNRLSIVSTLTLKPPASRTDSDATLTSTLLCPPALPTTLEKYAPLPSRISAMVKTLEMSDTKFASAYEAWSDSIKHQRRLAQSSSQNLATQLQQKDERIMELECELKRMGAENGGLKTRVGVLEREAASARREMAELVRDTGKSSTRENHTVGVLEAEGKVPVAEVAAGVEELNERICEVAMHLAAIIEPQASTSAKALSPLAEDSPLSDFLHSLSLEDIEPNIQTLLQATLASWCTRVIQSWDLSLDQQGSGELLSIYRRMKTVDPVLAAHWRSTTRGQLRFSSAQWTKSLLTSIQQILDATGLGYVKSEAYVSRVVDGLISATKNLRRALDSVVVSDLSWEGALMDVDVLLPAHGMAFEPSFMNNCDLQGQGEVVGTVLAGVQLGLTLARGLEEEREVVCYPGVVTRLRRRAEAGSWRSEGDGTTVLADETHETQVEEEEELPPPPIEKS